MKHDTTLVTAGRHPKDNYGIVNPPVYHASTVLYPTFAALEEARSGRDPRLVRYGRHGTPTTFALEDALAALEEAHGCVIYPSGLAAITAVLLALLKTGDHLLMLDSVYGPTRRFCDVLLRRMGIDTTYYAPLLGAGIADLIKDNTRVVYVESPGSLTFEVQDVPAIAAAAHARNAKVVMDNTWATPLYFAPLAMGANVSIQAATKYIVGHSDVMLGTATAMEADFAAVRSTALELGLCAGPDDIYLAQRGLRTMAVRLERHFETALKLARWLQQRSEVQRVLYPPLPEDPGHEIWRRDFSGGSGLFGVVLEPYSEAALAAMFDGFELFGLGYSWGGYESLIVPAHLGIKRTATTWDTTGPVLRIHAGLEDSDDLLADLERGFARLTAAA